MPGGAWYDVTEDFIAQDNLTVIRGRHSLKTGYELMRTRGNTLSASLPAGVYRFGATDLPFRPNTGNDFAAFLLGSVVRADFNTTLANWLPRWWDNSLYLQDDWSVTPRLTLNLGMRWSYESPFGTKYGQQSQFDPDCHRSADRASQARSPIPAGRLPGKTGTTSSLASDWPTESTTRWFSAVALA